MHFRFGLLPASRFEHLNSHFLKLPVADDATSDQIGNRQHAGGDPIAGGTIAASCGGATQKGAEGYTGKPSGGKQVA